MGTRKIIKIDEEKCNGCGICADACHEAALVIVDGKAKLIGDAYCDGLGDCLPICPRAAIQVEAREAEDYDDLLVQRHLAEKNSACGGSCPGSRVQKIHHTPAVEVGASGQSELGQWPVQIQLAPVKAQYFDRAKLLIAADCSAYARADFHHRFMRGHVTLIGCPKLDQVAYSDKLTEILRQNEIKAVTVVRMEVPCCSGIEQAVKTALQESGKLIPWQVVTLSVQGEILE